MSPKGKLSIPTTGYAVTTTFKNLETGYEETDTEYVPDRYSIDVHLRELGSCVESYDCFFEPDDDDKDDVE
jgi:hypothetical protein